MVCDERCDIKANIEEMAMVLETPDQVPHWLLSLRQGRCKAKVDTQRQILWPEGAAYTTTPGHLAKGLHYMSHD